MSTWVAYAMATPLSTTSTMDVRKAAAVDRTRVATANITALWKAMLLTANHRKACPCTAQLLGPNRMGSPYGIQLPVTSPAEMPSVGMSATSVLPRKRPNKYCLRVTTVLNTISDVRQAKSRMAVAFTKAVTMGNHKKARLA